MKMLVTGAAGFIGSNLVDKLVDTGHHVVAIDNESAAANETFYWNKNAENYKYDICDYEKIMPLFNGVDCVFHLAAESRIQLAIKNPLQAVKTNVLGTANILQASRESNVRRVVYSTTSSYYGVNNTLPNVETQKEDCLNPYSVSKVAGDKLCKMYYDLFGLETVSLRYFNVYGERHPTKGSYAPVIGLFIKQAAEGKALTVVGDGSQKRDFTNIVDVVDANVKASTYTAASYGEVFNVGCGKNYSILEIAEAISNNIVFTDKRTGEAKETLADVSKIKTAMGWEAKNSLFEWIKNNK